MDSIIKISFDYNTVEFVAKRHAVISETEKQLNCDSFKIQKEKLGKLMTTHESTSMRYIAVYEKDCRMSELKKQLIEWAKSVLIENVNAKTIAYEKSYKALGLAQNQLDEFKKKVAKLNDL